MTGRDYIKLQNQGNIISNIRLLYEMENSDGYADKHGYFTKRDVAEIGVRSLLITSGSKAGDDVEEILNAGGDESRNSALQNAKARMQILRVLGLVSSDYGSETYAITKLGELMVTQVLSTAPDFRLLRELFMGITTATENYEHNCSVDFHCYLGIGICYALANLDYRLSTDEMPMLTTYDIRNISEFVEDARANRTANMPFTASHPHFPKRANGNPQKNVSNLTRTINQVLRVCNIINPKPQKIDGRNYYVCTDEGKAYVDSINEKFDGYTFLTSFDFRKKNNITWQKQICVSSYNALLKRSGIDDSLDDSNTVFSPYQMLPETTVEWLMYNGKVRPHPEAEDEKISVINSQRTVTELRLGDFYKSAQENITTVAESEKSLLMLIRTKLSEKECLNSAANEICEMHKTDDKENFYPLVHSLLRLIGLECFGEVGRFDAYAKFREHVIPVEIKSYTETTAYNAKGIRQAIENKIMAYSPNVPNDLDYASIVIGYSHPSDDAEIRCLIDGAFEKLKIKVLTIDLPSLVKMALNIMDGHKSVDMEKMLCQHGFIIE